MGRFAGSGKSFVGIGKSPSPTRLRLLGKTLADYRRRQTDLNNLQIADLLSKFFADKKLD